MTCDLEVNSSSCNKFKGNHTNANSITIVHQNIQREF